MTFEQVDSQSTETSNTVPIPGFREALWVWIKIGLLSFGGPAGQIALMQRELVDTRRWISHQRFLRALNFCMLLPGPEAHQLAIYTGWLLHGYRGGVIAGALFVLPGALLLLGISFLYTAFGNTTLIASVSWGLRSSVIAIVLWAVIRMSKRVLNHWLLMTVAVTSFVSIYFFDVPFVVIVLSSLVLGAVTTYYFPSLVWSSGSHASGAHVSEDANYAISDTHETPHVGKPSWNRLAKNAVLWGTLWLTPTLFCIATLGINHYFSQAGLFFSQAALLTFGGAYSVLPFVAEHAVSTHHWLSAAEMMDGLGLAETTPGPLILVLQFVGFQGGLHSTNGAEHAWFNATIGAALTTWTTFMPGYLFIFCGAPYFEHAREVRIINKSLSMVTASVVGVILSLAVWFSWQTVFPSNGNVDFVPLVIALLFLWMIAARKCDAMWIVGLGILAGLIRWLASGA